VDENRGFPAAKLSLLATLYFSQGLPFGFFTQALPALMREHGVSLEHIGLASLLALPWVLKFLWAPFVERHYSPRWGRRRSWLLPLQIAAAAVMGILALADPAEALMWLVLGVLLTNLIAATQDISTDGLAVDLLTPEERGWGNGVQVAGYRLGMIFGGGALLVAFEYWGWAWTFGCASLALIAASFAILNHEEAPPSPRLPREEDSRLVEALTMFWKDRERRAWISVLVFYKFGDYVGTSMLRPFFVDRGQNLADIGILLGGIGFTAGLVGAVLGGMANSRFDRWTLLKLFGVLQGLCVASYALLLDPAIDGLLLYTPIVLEHLATGMGTVTLFTLMMDYCRPHYAGTDYTLQASVVVAATMLASAAGGFSAAWLGYADNFLLGGLLCGLAVVVAIIIQPRSQTRSEAG
jgi:MFS family permease